MPATDDPLRAVPSVACFAARSGEAGDGRRLCLLAVEVVASAAASVSRPPIDLVLVVDRSSSMVGARISAAVEAARQICLRLGGQDRLGVVAFDASAQVVRPSGPVGPGVAAEVALALSELGVGYGTNISEGWEKGAGLISRGGVPRASRTVLLLTDGLPSMGLRKPEELATLAAAGVDHGIATTAVGIGDGFDEQLLERMAHAGGGAFRFVQHEDDTVAVADEEVEGLTRLGADNAVLHVGFAPAVDRYEVLHDVPCRPDGDGTAIELGRLFAGRPRGIVIEAVCAPDALHLGVVGLSCLSVAGVSLNVEPVRILLPAPGQERSDAGLVGRYYVPLRIAEWQRRIWERGRDADPSRLRRVIAEALASVAAIPEELRASTEAREAVSRLHAVCDRIREILDDKNADEAQRRSRTSLTFKGLAEDTANTMMGQTNSPEGQHRRRRGWARRR